MRDLFLNIDQKNKWLIAVIGTLFFILYVLLLYFRPQESWCDDAFWADWARQLAVHDRYYTTVWGFGHPSYCPLYVFIMAIWYKIVGFSFFAAQFPNICFSLITYWVLMLILTGRKYLTNWQGIACFSILYWLAPNLFWTINCGRIEVLCLLLGTLTIYSFIRALETGAIKYKTGLFLSGLLLFATGVEGVVFATLFILIYSAYYYREAWQNKILYVWHFGSYIFSLVILGIITWSTHCLHQFFDTMFGFSKTFTSMYLYVRAFVKGAKHGEIVADQMQTSVVPKTPILQSIVDGYMLNWEYLALIVVVIILFAWFWHTVKWKNIPKSTLIIVTMALVTPFIYVLAGRYVTYYTWAAYIPCIIAVVLLMQQLHFKWIQLGIMTLMAIWFAVQKGPEQINNIRYHKTIDRQNREDIFAAQIEPNVPTCIPYSWYYYIVNENENIWFQGSGAYPENLGAIIYAPDEYNEEQFMKRYELQERCRIGDKIVYDVIR